MREVLLTIKRGTCGFESRVPQELGASCVFSFSRAPLLVCVAVWGSRASNWPCACLGRCLCAIMFMCGVYGTSRVILRLVGSTTLGHNYVRELPQIVFALAFVQIHDEMGLPHHAHAPVILVPPAHKQLRHISSPSQTAGAHLWASLARLWREVK